MPRKTRTRKKPFRKKLAFQEDPEQEEGAFWSRIWSVVEAMLLDVDVCNRVEDAISLKNDGEDALFAKMRSSTIADGVAREVRRLLDIAPTAKALAAEFTAEELENLAEIARRTVTYWEQEIDKVGSTIPETMRRRRRYLLAEVLQGDAPGPGVTRDQKRAEDAKKLGMTVGSMMKLPRREPPEAKGGLFALLSHIEDIRPGYLTKFLQSIRSSRQ